MELPGLTSWLKKSKKRYLKLIFWKLFVSNKEDLNNWDEPRLIPLLKQGDEEAFRVFVRRYQRRLFCVAYGITLDKEESLEIVQEVFVKVYQKIRTFREEARLSTWLYRITINQCLNWHRKSKQKLRKQNKPPERNYAADYVELLPDEDNPGTLYEKKELRRIFWEWVQDLPEEARAVLVLKELEGLSYDEIASISKIKKGTVSSRLFYARKRLKESLKKYEKGL